MMKHEHEDDEESEGEAMKEDRSHARHKCEGCGEDCVSEMSHKKHKHHKKSHHEEHKKHAIKKALEKAN